jgi:hypothetical protein
VVGGGLGELRGVGERDCLISCAASMLDR